MTKSSVSTLQGTLASLKAAQAFCASLQGDVLVALEMKGCRIAPPFTVALPAAEILTEAHARVEWARRRASSQTIQLAAGNRQFAYASALKVGLAGLIASVEQMLAEATEAETKTPAAAPAGSDLGHLVAAKMVVDEWHAALRAAGERAKAARIRHGLPRLELADASALATDPSLRAAGDALVAERVTAIDTAIAQQAAAPQPLNQRQCDALIARQRAADTKARSLGLGLRQPDRFSPRMRGEEIALAVERLASYEAMLTELDAALEVKKIIEQLREEASTLPNLRVEPLQIPTEWWLRRDDFAVRDFLRRAQAWADEFTPRLIAAREAKKADDRLRAETVEEVATLQARVDAAAKALGGGRFPVDYRKIELCREMTAALEAKATQRPKMQPTAQRGRRSFTVAGRATAPAATHPIVAPPMPPAAPIVGRVKGFGVLAALRASLPAGTAQTKAPDATSDT